MSKSVFPSLHLLGLLLLVACAPKEGGSEAPVPVNEGASSRRYVGHSPDECARIRFTCETGEEYFSDDKGCGCTPAGAAPAEGGAAEGGGEPAEGGAPIEGGAPAGGTAPAEGGAAPTEPTVCTAEARKAEVCAEVYTPVCGLYDPAQIQCVRAPCGETFSSPCHACRDTRVTAFTPGECK